LTPVPSPTGSRPSTPTGHGTAESGGGGRIEAGADDDEGMSDASSVALASKLKKKRKRTGAIVSDDERVDEDDRSAATTLAEAADAGGPDRKRERMTPAAATPTSSQALKPGKAGGGDELPRFKRKDKSREPSVAAGAAAAGSRAQTPPASQSTSTPAASERKTATPQPPAAAAATGSPAPAAAPAMPKIKLSISSAARAVSPLAGGSTPSGSVGHRSPKPPAVGLPPTGQPAILPPPPPLGAHIDFRLPLATRSLVPVRPAVAEPLPSLPLTQAEVADDFTQTKPPASQLLFATFLTHAEAFTRPVGEEDLAFLKGYKDEDTEPYVVPPLGQHYTHQFAEEDRLAALGQPYVPPAAGAPGAGPPNTSLDYPRLRKADFGFDPLESLAEEGLVDEARSLGPVSERVVGGLLDAKGEHLDRFQHSHLLPPPPSPPPPPPAAQQPSISTSMLGEASARGSSSGDRQVDGSLGRLEERMKKELQLVGLLGDEPVRPSPPRALSRLLLIHH